MHGLYVHFIVKAVTSVHRVYSTCRIFSSFKERQRQGHKDGTSDIYWDSWDTGKTREKTISTSLSERSSRSSVTLDNDIPLSSPSSDADTEGSRLSTLSASDTDSVLSPKQHSPLPFHYTVRANSPSSPLKRSVSDEVNLGKNHHLKITVAVLQVLCFSVCRSKLQLFFFCIFLLNFLKFLLDFLLL